MLSSASLIITGRTLTFVSSVVASVLVDEVAGLLVALVTLSVLGDVVVLITGRTLTFVSSVVASVLVDEVAGLLVALVTLSVLGDVVVLGSAVVVLPSVVAGGAVGGSDTVMMYGFIGCNL